jgi:hypothetical protein
MCRARDGARRRVASDERSSRDVSNGAIFVADATRPEVVDGPRERELFISGYRRPCSGAAPVAGGW